MVTEQQNSIRPPINSAEELDNRFDALISFHRETLSERVIVDHSEEVLEELKACRSLPYFTEKHAELLAKVADTTDKMVSFVDAVEEMATMKDLDEYQEIHLLFSNLLDDFATFSVSKRINKEMRELVSKRSGLTTTTASKRRGELERRAPECRKGHRMTLRQEKDGSEWFWGCSQYPKCDLTKPLNDVDAERINA